mgnify:FL=1
MDTIIIIGLSVLATLMSVSVIWAVNGLRKSQIDIKYMKEELNSIHLMMDEIESSLWEDIKTCNNKRESSESDLHNEIRKYNEDVYEYTESKIKETNEYILATQTELDRRFDKIYTKLYREFPQLNDKVQQINS